MIHDFSRLNFVSTTLSKRKLNWFVENKIAENWDDPRFPTIKGILRRGMLVQTLVEFMLEQGPSKNTNLMEWDKIWALNRKNIDPISLKYTAISKMGSVILEIENVTKDESGVILFPIHPKMPELGDKPIFKSKYILVEKEDIIKHTEKNKASARKIFASFSNFNEIIKNSKK